jgi:hypothetical protein
MPFPASLSADSGGAVLTSELPRPSTLDNLMRIDALDGQHAASRETEQGKGSHLGPEVAERLQCAGGSARQRSYDLSVEAGEQTRDPFVDPRKYQLEHLLAHLVGGRLG